MTQETVRIASSYFIAAIGLALILVVDWLARRYR
jgi:hypothetical protein